MKSRISFFNGAAFRKDLTRFSPLWGLYILCLMLGLLLMLGAGTDYVHSDIGTCLELMPIVNLGYALLVAQVLFGDLFNTRMCNALHAMPLRRETWFGTHVAAGLVFSLVPTACMTLVALLLAPFSVIEEAWQIPLYWMLGINLQYLFYFGLAVLSMFCTGNRVAAALVYGILNFGSTLVYFLVGTLYIPLLHGVVQQETPYINLCPTVRIPSSSLIITRRHDVVQGYAADGSTIYTSYGTFQLTDQWGYLWIIAGVGLVLLGLALVLYRRRRLECAGDFVAIKKLEPFFMVLFSLSAATLFQLTYELFYGSYYYEGIDPGALVFLFAGLTAGWFAGRMMLERQIRVFRRGKNWLGLAVLAVALAGSLGIVKLDPLGIEDWIPEPEDVAFASVGRNTASKPQQSDPEEIANILRLHELALEDKLTQQEARADYDAAWAEYNAALAEQAEAGEAAEVTEWKDMPVAAEHGVVIKLRDYRRYTYICINYRLHSGRLVQREYYVMLDTEEGELARHQFSSVANVFNDLRLDEGEDVTTLCREAASIHVAGRALDGQYTTKEAVTELIQAMVADCEAGTMAQGSNFHEGLVLDEENISWDSYWITIDYGDGSFGIDIYADAENTLAWLEKTGILETIRQEPNAS